MSKINFDLSRPINIIVAGRAGIDLNTIDISCAFKDNRGYTKTVGGSPANIVQGLAKLGVKVGFIGKISDNGMGEYIKETFEDANVDTNGIVFDKTGAPNCVAITFIKTPVDCGSFFYRNGTADLLLEPSEISQDYIKNAAAVLLSGTAFSQSPSREAMFTIIEYAKMYKTKVIIDIDYRPFGWKSPEETAIYYNLALASCDIIIGNREEFNAVEYLTMRDNRDNDKSAKALLNSNASLVIIKDGEKGSIAFTKDKEPIRCGIIKTKALKTFGSGDAFAAGLLYGLFNDMELIDAMKFGSACGSMALKTVSCADGLPKYKQVISYMTENKFLD